MNKIIMYVFVVVGAIGGAMFGRWAVDGMFSKPTDYTTVLMEVANKINSNLPMTIDSETELVSTVGFKNSFTYKYKLINYDVSEMDVKKFKNEMIPKLQNSVCTSESMSEFRKMKIVVKYSYSDASHKEIAEFLVDTKNCEKI
ncbi:MULTISPECIES: hypothetical protein [Shewanella]|nr:MULTISPECIES: hypothetical protein [Shewanella]MDT3281714.1 hypothetical protein [Shewanella sp. SP2S1-2]